MRIAIDPKKEFLADEAIARAFSAFTGGVEFRLGAKAAMLAYQDALLVGEPANPAAVSIRLKGAREFLAILINIGERDAPKGFQENEGLDRPEDHFIDNTKETK